MKKIIFYSIIFLFINANLTAQSTVVSGDQLLADTLSKKQERKNKKIEKRLDFRNNYSRSRIKMASVGANLTTKLSFDLPSGILSANLGLEDNLGLAKSKIFLTGSFSYFFTPRSGLYAEYYGINRQEHIRTDQDYIFLEDTIVAGTNASAHFNTQVISAGYLLTILRDREVFVGAYFNIYFMRIGSGIKSDDNSLDTKFNLLAPLPNFGLISSIKVKKWLHLHGGIGFFSLNTKDFGGSIFSLNVALEYKPIDLIGISLSYQEFDVSVFFLSSDVKTTVDYNFRGPALAVSFDF